MYITDVIVLVFFSFNCGWTHSRSVGVAPPEQPLDFIPCAKKPGRTQELADRFRGLTLGQAASNFCWTAGLGHLPGLMTWAWAARTDSRARESSWVAFTSPSQPAGIDRKNRRREKERVVSPPTYLLYHWDPGSQDGGYMHHRRYGILRQEALSSCLLLVFRELCVNEHLLSLIFPCKDVLI